MAISESSRSGRHWGNSLSRGVILRCIRNFFLLKSSTALEVASSSWQSRGSSSTEKRLAR